MVGLPGLISVPVLAMWEKSRCSGSIAAVFGSQLPPGDTGTDVPATPPGEVDGPLPKEITDLINQALERYLKAQEYSRTGNWAGYGEEMAALETVLEELAELTGIE